MSAEESNAQAPAESPATSVAAKAPRIDRTRLIPVAIVVNYVGQTYLGLQLQVGKNHGGMEETVEGVVLMALHKAGLVSSIEGGRAPKEVKFARASRTDKGVSALRNVLTIFANPESLGLGSTHQQNDDAGDEDDVQQQRAVAAGPLGPAHIWFEAATQKVNAALDEMGHSDVHVASIFRTQPHFNPRNFCRSRIYHYLVPLFAILPTADSWPVVDGKPESAEWLKSFTELLKPTLPQGKTLSWSELDLKAFEGKEGPLVDIKSAIERFDTTLKKFQGLHRFHNFTSEEAGRDVHPTETQAIRNILRIGVASRVLWYYHAEGGKTPLHRTSEIDARALPFLVVQLEGVSFLYNMIRKMLGMAIAVCRGSREGLLDDALDVTKRVSVPLAPGENLMLHWQSFRLYDQEVLSKPRCRSGTFDAAFDKTEEMVNEHFSANVYTTMCRAECPLRLAADDAPFVVPGMTKFVRMMRMNNWNVRPVKGAARVSQNFKRDRKRAEDEDDAADEQQGGESTGEAGSGQPSYLCNGWW